MVLPSKKVQKKFKGDSMRNISLIREYVRTRADHLLWERTILLEDVLSSYDFHDLVLEGSLLLMEAEASEGGGATVGSILAALDDKVSEMDSSMIKLVNEIINLSSQYSPENVSKILKTGQKSEKEMQEIVGWFKTLKELALKLKEGWSKSKSDHPDSLKNQIVSFFSANKELSVKAFNHLKALKTLWDKNELFKESMKATGFAALKKFWDSFGSQVLEAIPIVGTIIKGAKMIGSIFNLGGKIKELFKKAKEVKAPPEDKFAAVAKSLVKGKDQNLGALTKIIQIDDDIEAVLDDGLESKFVQWYVAKLREMSPETPLSEINANSMLTDFIKGEFGKPRANVSLDAGGA